MVSSGIVMNSTPIVRRNPPGTRSEDFYKWPEQGFDEMDSTLVVQQYIQQMIRRDHTDIEGILTVPTGQDEGVWKYEQLRQFCLELNGLAVKLQGDCTPDSCPQMTATEQWIFLCAAHKTPKECPAIDYTRHTLDGAACLLNSNKYFPSRVSIKESSVAKLGSVCRRVYRIFSHAYYHHRHIFDEAENETYLCRRFTSFVTKYNLMSQDNLIVPILDERAGNQSNNNSADSSQSTVTITLAKKPATSNEAGEKPSIASFLNLPEGVVPDLDDDEENLVTLDLTELDAGSSGFDEDGGSTEIDDDFAYSDEAGYGTLKPGKMMEAMMEANKNNSNNVESDDALEMNETVLVDEVNAAGDATGTDETVKQDDNQL